MAVQLYGREAVKQIFSNKSEKMFYLIMIALTKLSFLWLKVLSNVFLCDP